MIPRAHITAWRTSAPWPENEQVEQDLLLSRALVELFSDSVVADGLAFRGGTALNKLSDPRFLDDIAPLLAPGSPWDVDDAARYARVVSRRLILSTSESWMDLSDKRDLRMKIGTVPISSGRTRPRKIRLGAPPRRVTLQHRVHPPLAARNRRVNVPIDHAIKGRENPLLQLPVPVRAERE